MTEILPLKIIFLQLLIKILINFKRWGPAAVRSQMHPIIIKIESIFRDLINHFYYHLHCISYHAEILFLGLIFLIW